MVMRIKTSAETSAADINIARILETPGGFEKIATETLPPFIRETRDYESFGRQILIAHPVTKEDVHPIDGTDFVYYPKDQNSHAAFYADDSEIPRLQIEGDGVNVAIVTVSSDDVTISERRLLTQQFNYLERVRELSGQALAKAEDKKILQLTERLILGNSEDHKAPENVKQVVTTADSDLLKSHLVDLKKTLTQHNVPTGAFVMSPARLDDMLKWATAEIDQLTQREILETGAKYSIWGIKLITSPIIEMNTVYCFGEAEYVGRMPILQDVTTKLTETKNKLEKGLFLFEFVGFYLASHKAVGKLILEFKEGDNKVDIQKDSGVMAREGEIKGIGSREEI